MRNTNLMALGVGALICLSTVVSPMAYAQSEQIKNLNETEEGLSTGETYYVTANRLTVRSLSKKPLGYLNRSDKVELIDNSSDLPEGYVLVKVTYSFNYDANGKRLRGNQFLVSSKYLSGEKNDYRNFDGKYFVIQNLATERLRVYEKHCNEDQACKHKMIMETEMVVGENTKDGGTRTYVGSYRLTEWVKFYEDGKGEYPAWYREGYPFPPGPESGAMTWFRDKYMPEENGKPKGSMRGAFGWYAALIGPNHNSQWTHGTIGWGENKDEFILKTKKFFSNVVSDPRSHGCSRLNNEAIAFLREKLPVGTPFIKIYAKEALLDGDRLDYPERTNTWDYILTKERTSKAYSSDEQKVLDRGVSQDMWLEQGRFEYDAYPNLVYYTPAKALWGWRAKLKDRGNVYKVRKKAMRGVYFVDAGLLFDYKHPIDSDKHNKIEVGGFKDEVAPKYMWLNRNEITLDRMSWDDPEVKRKYYQK